MENLSLVVVSTDSYSDTWDVFFANFKKYWPEFRGNKYLITDTLLYSSYEVKTILPANNQYNGFHDWGGRLLSCLNQIEEENILMVLEDYILIDFVSQSKISMLFKSFQEKNIDFLSIGTHDLNRKGKASMRDEIVKVKKFTKYRLTTAPGIWKVNSLKKFLRRGLNPWQFEIIGTYASYFRKDKFYMLNRMKYNLNYEVFPYFMENGLDSAVVRGKWQKGIKSTVDKSLHKILDKRGFFEFTTISKLNTIKKVISNPIDGIIYFVTTIGK